MRNMKRWLAALLAVVMVLPSLLIPGLAAGSGFEDVPENSWYASAVEYVNEKGYMTGVGNDKFAPDAEVTRAMFVTVLSRLAMVQTDGLTSDFADVAAGRWYTGAIAWAAENGIVNGVGGGRFVPTKAISRQDLCTILYRFVNTMGYQLTATQDVSFTDASSISGYASDAVRFAASVGLVAGYSDGAFHPKDTATRAQTAVIVMRLAQLLDGQIVKPEPMPAQSFNQTADQMKVSVTAPEGALPEGTKMTTSAVTGEALTDLQSKLDADVLGAVDISFAKDGAELEPARKVNVRIALDGIQNAENPAVVHIRDDGSFEYVASNVITTRGKTAEIEFEADSFSVYAVLDDATGSHTLTISFYARKNGSSGAWEIVNKQIIRADQLGEGKTAISDPGVPNITTSQAFEGWMLEGENVAFNADFTYGPDTAKYSVKQMNDYCNENPPTGADREVVLYAAVYDVVYVTYHDQADAIIYAEYKKLVDGSASADITLPYTPFKDNQNFKGWVAKDYVTAVGDIEGTMPTYTSAAEDAVWAQGSTQSITASVDLFPYLEEGFWLIFDNNIAGNNTAYGYNDDVAATYTPSIFVAYGKRVVEPTEPTRSGYSFGGWYTDKAMTNEYNWGSAESPVYLDKETTLYAKWDQLETASYRVVIWRQRVSDDKDATQANRTYDYFFSTTLTGNTGDTVLDLDDVKYFQSFHTNPNVTKATKVLYMNVKPDESHTTWKYMGGFHYLRTAANFDTIKSNGSTVVNVYWDRDIVTYRFYSSSYSEYTSYKQSGLYEAEVPSWPSDEVMWMLTKTGGVPSSSNTSNSYISISKVFSLYESSNGSPSVLRDDKTVYFYEDSVDTPSATLRHFIQELNDDDTTYYPTTAESTVYMYYMNGHTFREFKGHENAEFRVKLPSSSGYIYSAQGGTSSSSTYFTAPFTYQLVTAVSGSGSSATITTSGDVKTPTSSNEYWTEWIPFGTSLIIKDANNKVVFSPTTYGSVTGYQAPGQAIDFRYKLAEATVKYMYGTFVDKDGNTIPTGYAGTIHTSDSYYYGQSITSAGNYVPTVPGYVFIGWYSSPTCDAASAYSFSGEKMPEGGVTVYAKFQQMRFRVICDPTDAGKVTDVSFPGAQATMFRVDYGELVSGTALNAAISPKRILLGWYTDKDCTKPFNFSTPITDTIDGMDMTYRTATNKSGTDPWNNNKAYTDGDIVVGKLIIYAKWREDPEGVVGIKVRYLGDHSDTDKGFFDTDEKPHEVTMVEVYTDEATAAAHSASVPSLTDEDTKDENRRFLYWEILDKNGNPTGEIVYPGAPFTVDIDKAVEIKTPLPDPNCAHTGTRTHHDAVAASCETAGNVEYWTCNTCGASLNAASGGNVIDPTVAALGHQWGTATYVWDPSENLPVDGTVTCTGTVVCGRNSEHTKTATATAKWIVDSDPTTAATGTGHYEATFTDTSAFSKQNSAFVTIPKLTGYTVTFSVPSGVTAPAQQVVEPGSNANLSVAPAGEISGWTFVGWVENTVSDTTTAVTPLTTYKPTGDATLHALYTREEVGGKTFTRLSSAPSSWTGNFLITYGNDSTMYILKGLPGNYSYESVEYGGAVALANTGATLSGSNLSNVGDIYAFAVAESGSYKTFRNLATDGYLARYVTDSNALLASLMDNFTDYDQMINWAPSISSGKLTLTNSCPTTVGGTEVSSDYPVLGFDSDDKTFWVASSGGSTTTNLYLWQQTADSSVTHYTTQPSVGSGYTVSFSVPSTVSSVESQTVSAGSCMILPQAEAPDGYFFWGWSETNIADTASVPAYLAWGSVYTPTSDVELKAVYVYDDVYYQRLTAEPSSYTGYYVISSGYTSSDYLMASTTGDYTGNGDARTSMNQVTISDNGTVLRGVADTNRFWIDYAYTSSTTYLYLENEDDYLVRYYSSRLYAYYTTSLSGAYSMMWSHSYSSGKFIFRNYNNSDYYIGYNSTNYFTHVTSSYAGVYLWERHVVPHYVTTNGISTSAVVEPILAGTQIGRELALNSLEVEAKPLLEQSAAAEPVSEAVMEEALTADREAVEAEESADLQIAVSNPNPVTATTDKYELVDYSTGLESGAKYLITTTINGTKYVMTTTYYDTTNSECPIKTAFTATQGSDGKYELTLGSTTYGNLDDFLFTAESATGGWKFNNSSVGYLGEDSNGYPIFGTTNNIWEYTNASKLNNTTQTSYPLLTAPSNTTYFSCNNSGGATIYFYKLVESTTPTTYNVTVASGITNGTVTADKATAAAGETVTLTVTPASGYEVSSVTYTPAGGTATTITATNGAYTFTMPSANVTVSATFTATAATTYTVTVDSGIANGTVTADKATAAAGETVTLTVTPASGYEVSSVTYTPAGGSATTITATNGAYTFTMPSANVSVSAAFVASSGPSTTTTEVWAPTDTIVAGEDYLIGFVVDGKTYLAVNYSEVNTSNHYYYSYSSNYYGYTALATLDENGYVTAVSGNTSDLAHCTWKFSTTTGGTITSGYESGRYLRTYSTTEYHDLYPATSDTYAQNWVWSKSAKTLTRSVDGTTMYAEHVGDSSDGHYMGMYTTRTESEYVQLFKKQTITVYNVTVNSADNGYVRSDHTTAIQGETVTLTVTPSEDYEIGTVTVTAAGGAAVEVTHESGGIYTFTMPAANVTVSATFKAVVSDTVWTVSFQDEDGKPIPGMNDIYVEKADPANTLSETDLPKADKTDYYFLGWYQGGTKCGATITVDSDIVLTPKYSPMFSYDYTLTLRAVYGTYNPDATTHIYWYANNGTEAHGGAGERYVSVYTEDGETTTKLPINASVDIPVPTATRAGTTVFVGDQGGALTWDDHIFLGWARLETTGSGQEGEAKVLTAEDLYLKWDNVNKKYLVKNDSGEFVNFTSQKVYADETTPYHDMYAVWAGFYYVFHSSDGSMEAIEVPARDTANLKDKVASGYLYGGYYSEYGGVKPVPAATMRETKDNILNGENFWDYSTNAVKTNGTTTATVPLAETYDASAIRLTYTDPETHEAGQSARFWSSANACKVLGTAVTPTVGTVYYLKEVPAAYLPARMLTIRHTGDNTGEDSGSEPIEALYLLTSVDDTNYKDFGCLYGTSKNPTQFESYYSFSKAFITLYKTYENGTEVIRKKEYYACDLSSIPANDARTNGYVVSYQIDVQNAFVTPAWITLDGVTVSQNPYQVNIDTSNNTVSWNPAP